MAANQLDKFFEDVFIKKAPALPKNARQALVQWAPWVSLVVGVLTLWSALALWNWAHVANNLINYANTLSRAYGGGDVVSNRLTAGIWLGLLVLAVEGIMYIAAFPALKARKKSGWNLLYYALLVNVAYGVVVMFTNYGNVSNLIGTLIGSAIGLYFLYQLRGSYSDAPVKATKRAS